jgi:hypothetical protein
MAQSPNDRLIDQQRNAALMMELGSPGEGRITEAFPVADKLYTIKENAIYAVQLADAIDPNRTNIAIPNVQQKIASEGSQSEIVCKVLLTGRELFNKSYLTPHVDCERCLFICIQVLQELLAMKELATSLRHVQEEAVKAMGQKPDGSLLLPAIPDLMVRAKTFIQRADHVTQNLYILCVLFFGEELKDKGKLFDGLSTLLREKYGESDNFSRFGLQVAQCCKFLRNTRNCVEHADSLKYIEVKDFSLLLSSVKIMPPTIEIVHQETPEPRIPLVDFMDQVVDGVLNLTEQLIAFLCSKHVHDIPGLEVQVAEVPENQRVNKKTRFGYVVWFGDQIVRTS